MDEFYYGVCGDFPVYCCGVLGLSIRKKKDHYALYNNAYYTPTEIEAAWSRNKRDCETYVTCKNNKRHFLVTSEDGVPLEDVKRILATTVNKDKYMIATNADGAWVVGIFTKEEV